MTPLNSQNCWKTPENMTKFSNWTAFYLCVVSGLNKIERSDGPQRWGVYLVINRFYHDRALTKIAIFSKPLEALVGAWEQITMLLLIKLFGISNVACHHIRKNHHITDASLKKLLPLVHLLPPHHLLLELIQNWVAKAVLAKIM